jgi:molybdenum cofactor synthesis domain-containing protein
MKTGTIKAICISEKKGTQKTAVESASFLVDFGIKGDAHTGDWHRQVSLISYDKVLQFNELGAGVGHGAFGENLVVDEIDFRSLPVGTKLNCGSVVLEITQIGKECHSHCQIYHKMGDCIMPREGVFARVLSPGNVSAGDKMEVILPQDAGQTSGIFRAAIITMSDKSSKGEREDLSGPVILKMLEEKGFLVEEQLILPDAFDTLKNALIDLSDRRQFDLILTTGGTGFSHRDITPEATLAVSDRNAPGIAEAIRAYSIQITGNAMLSRGVSVLRGSALIINLPGSPKAVRESLEYILPHIGHGLEVLRGEVSECATK